MRLTTSWVLPALIGAASAASDSSAFIVSSNHVASSNTPTLSPEQARLVFASRLGVSRYHSLADADSSTISHINQYGGHHNGLFEYFAPDLPIEVVMIVEGVSSEQQESLSDSLPAKPDFYISGLTSKSANAKFADDVSKQLRQVSTCIIEENDTLSHEYGCWRAQSRILYHDVSKSPEAFTMASQAIRRIQEYSNCLVVLVPQTSKSSKSAADIYGSYDMPTKDALRRRQFEEPMAEPATSDVNNKPVVVPHALSNSTKQPPIRGVPPVCYSTLDSCTEKTNHCSGHGKCYKKRDACFACGCVAQNQTFTHGPNNRTGVRITYWGGAACQKEDVSSQFWLIAIFSVVLVSVVAWAIGMMYSVGEEKLPGVIGAGVSSNRAR